MSHAICFITTYFRDGKNSIAGKMQEQKFKENFLNQPIAELDTSEEFKALTARYGYNTLADILRRGKAYEMLKHEGFGYRMLFELTGILTRNGLGGYLD